MNRENVKGNQAKKIILLFSIIYGIVFIISIFFIYNLISISENFWLILDIYGISIFFIFTSYFLIEILNLILENHFGEKERRKIRIAIMGMLAFSLPLPLALAFSFSSPERDHALDSIRIFNSLFGLFIFFLYNLVTYYKSKSKDQYKKYKEKDISKGMFWRKI